MILTLWKQESYSGKRGSFDDNMQDWNPELLFSYMFCISTAFKLRNLCKHFDEFTEVIPICWDMCLTWQCDAVLMITYPDICHILHLYVYMWLILWNEILRYVFDLIMRCDVNDHVSRYLFYISFVCINVNVPVKWNVLCLKIQLVVVYKPRRCQYNVIP